MNRPTRRTILRTAGVVLGGLLLLALLAWIGLRAYLRSSHARDYVAAQLQEKLGMDVRVEDLNVGLNSSSIRLHVMEPAGDETPEKPFLSVDEAVSDVPLSSLLAGETPRSFKLKGAHLNLRFDRDGKLLTQLPKGRAETGELPAVQLEGGTLTIQQTGRPDFRVTGLEGQLKQEGEQLTLTGAVHDPAWGDWTVHGSWDRKANAGAGALETQETHITQPMLDSLPLIPESTWKQVKFNGQTPVQFTVEKKAASDPVHYRITLDPTDTSVRIESIDLTVDKTRGHVVIEDDVIRVNHAQGRAADGDIGTDSTMDFTKSPSTLTFEVTTDNVDVTRLPSSWSIPSEIAGRLKGSAHLELRIPKDGTLETRGQGEGIIKNGTVAGIPAESIRLVLHSDGQRVRFGSATAALHQRATDGPRQVGSLERSATNLAILVGVLLVQPDAPPLGQANYLDADFDFHDVDLAQLLEKLNVSIPFAVTGRLTVNLKVRIPLEKARNAQSYQAKGTAIFSRVTIENLELEDVTADLDYHDGVLALTHLTGFIPPVDSSPDRSAARGKITGSARLGVSPQTDLKANLKLKDVPLAQALRPLPGAADRAKGRFSGSFDARAPANSLRDFSTWEASGTLTAKQLTLYDRRLENVHCDLRLERGSAKLSGTRLVVEGLPIEGEGALRLADDFPYQAKIKTKEDALVSLERLVPEWRPPVSIEGKVATSANLKGTLKPLTIRASGAVKAAELIVAETKVGNLSFDWDADADRLHIAELRASLRDGTLTGNATVPFRPTVQGNIKLAFKEVPLETIAKAATSLPVQLEGNVDGSLDGTLPPVKEGADRQANFDLDLQAPTMRVQGIPTERLKGKLSYHQGILEYQLDGDTLGGKFQLDGKAPPPEAEPKKVPEEPGEGRFRLEGVQLSRLSEALKIQSLASLSGQVDMALTYRYEGFNRIQTGSGRLTVSQLRWGAEGAAETLRADVRLTEDALRIDNLSGSLAGGSAEGRVQWNRHQPDRSFFLLTLGQVDSSKLFAPFPELARRLQAPLDVRLRGRFGRTWTGSGQVAFAGGKVLGLSLTDVRLPIEWTFNPKNAGGELVIRDAAGHAANGRLVGQTTIRWGLDNHVDGSIRFVDVGLRSLLAELGDFKEAGVGRATGRFTFKGDDVHSINDLTGDLTASLAQTQTTELPILRQITPYLSPAQSLTFREGDLKARLNRGVFNVQRLALTSSASKLFAWGNVTLQGKLDLDVMTTTRQLAISPAFLRLFGLRIPATGAIPVALLMEIGSYLSNRTLQLHVTGTIREPNVQVNSTALLSEEVVRFFLNRSNLPPP